MFSELFGEICGWGADWIINTLSKKRFYVTETGDIGNGLETIAAGDEIFIVGDSWMPSILRRTENDLFAYHGETYLDSVFEGSPANTQVRGTATKFPRGLIDGLNAILAALKKKEHEISPFFALYDLNPHLMETIQLA
jgi:hypothetical protein